MRKRMDSCRLRSGRTGLSVNAPHHACDQRDQARGFVHRLAIYLAKAYHERVKPGSPYVPHAPSRSSLELSIRSWELMAATWTQIARQAQGDRRAKAEAKLVECESELSRLRRLINDLDSGAWPGRAFE